jgi:uncharacterized protein YjiS (DUF1127 family)
MNQSHCIDSIDGGFASREPSLTWETWLRAGVKLVEGEIVRLTDTVQSWHERARQRRTLMALSDHSLKDIGLSRADAWAESAQPFWRP